jgi:hypothetical protein
MKELLYLTPSKTIFYLLGIRNSFTQNDENTYNVEATNTFLSEVNQKAFFHNHFGMIT